MRAALLLSVFALPVQALTVELPAGAELTREVIIDEGARSVPTGPTDPDAEVPAVKLANGTVTIQAYRIEGGGAPAALMAPVMQSVEVAGFETLLSCETESCGGFDFRFSLELIPPPDMFVDLSDFVFLSATDGEEYVSALASRSATVGYVHLSRITPAGEMPATVQAVPAAAATATPAGSLGETLEAAGRVVLEDLTFASGSTILLDDEYQSLEELAVYLSDNPSKVVALVGHTDASGALDLNVAISKERAAAARTLLINTFGVPAGQVTAEGMGYLAPRATNSTAEGRTLNRRVEVILISTN
ncbi:MAG: OmpA family protein [Rhodobacteraceae bacterium]|nr:OmpA family protein [Paracoccaceae bacterium]